MKKGSKSSFNLKRLKEEINNCFNDKKYDDALLISTKIIDASPKNIYGYISYIKAYTHEYNKLLTNDELRLVKKYYDKALEVSSKSDKIMIKKEIDDYLSDIKEVENLNKIKTDLLSKYFLKDMYINSIAIINQRITDLSRNYKNGNNVKNIYDFLRGMFYVLCLLYNLTAFNYLLLLTIPFGIFGIITMISFIEMNFFSKGKYKIEKNTYEKMIDDDSNKIKKVKQEIKKLEDQINFLKNQKKDSINKIPQIFTNDIKKLILNDEEKKGAQIFDLLISNNITEFTLMLDKNTNLKACDVVDKFQNIIDNEEISKYINDKKDEKKNNQKEAMLMKKIRPINVVSLIIMIVVSVFSIIILINNFYEMHLQAFIIAVLVGFLSMSFYNINTGKKGSVSDTFYDNLLSTTFNATLVYDIIYYKITNSLSITYGFIQIPITLILVLIGFVYLISFLKYNNYLKKLRG